MRIRSQIQRRVGRYVFDPKRQFAQGQKAERRRQAEKKPHLVEYFHETGDPYSHLMVQLLPQFCQRYDVELKVHIVPPPPDWAAPDRPRLEAYARLDCARLAAKAGLNFTYMGTPPSAERLKLATSALITAGDAGQFLAMAADIGNRLWTGRALAPQVISDDAIGAKLSEGAARRDGLGHYLGATLHYGGVWYWGPDRLHYLEARLQDLGAQTTGPNPPPLFLPPAILTEPMRAASPTDAGAVLHWYLSFRSPYTALVAARVEALAAAYGAQVRLRYVLPMVMRGMKVPRKKSYYIMHDAVREAARQSIPFGDFCDPVGAPIARGYAGLQGAIARGQGMAFARSFLSGVWAEGIDAGSDTGLRKISERAGLAWADMQALLQNASWKATAESNRQEMFDLGLWGVPSFRVGDICVWGQDRLWVVEDALKTTARQRRE